MIVDNIRRLCADRGISLYRLERDTGLGNGTVARWNESSPSVERLRLVADYFDVSLDDLIRHSPEKEEGEKS